MITASPWSKGKPESPSCKSPAGWLVSAQAAGPAGRFAALETEQLPLPQLLPGDMSWQSVTFFSPHAYGFSGILASCGIVPPVLPPYPIRHKGDNKLAHLAQPEAATWLIQAVFPKNWLEDSAFRFLPGVPTTAKSHPVYKGKLQKWYTNCTLQGRVLGGRALSTRLSRGHRRRCVHTTG